MKQPASFLDDSSGYLTVECGIMSLMSHSKAEQTLTEIAVLLSYMREVPFEGKSKVHFGQLAYNTNTKPQ